MQQEGGGDFRESLRERKWRKVKTIRGEKGNAEFVRTGVRSSLDIVGRETGSSPLSKKRHAERKGL